MLMDKFMMTLYLLNQSKIASQIAKCLARIA